MLHNRYDTIPVHFKIHPTLDYSLLFILLEDMLMWNILNDAELVLVLAFLENQNDHEDGCRNGFILNLINIYLLYVWCMWFYW